MGGLIKPMHLRPPNRTIMHIDLNSFFASAEQQANPFLRGKSMGVGHRGYAGSAILAASYPAKWQGIGLSTRLNVAKQIDPNFEMANMDPIKYYDLHNKFMRILGRYSPIIEVYSVDEAFLDITQTERHFGSAKDMSFAIKHEITQEMGEALTCSIGIAGNKLLAKIASNYDKPDGITRISWKERFEFLDPMKIEDVWGIGRNVSRKMYKRGITTVGQIRDLTDSDLYSIIGGYYTRLRLLVDGYNFDSVQTTIRKKPAQSMQHAHTLEDATDDSNELKSLTRKMIERLCIRLRKHNQKTSKGFINFAEANLGKYDWGFPYWFGENFILDKFTNHGMDIYKKCAPLIEHTDLKGKKIRRIVVGLFDLTIPDALLIDDFTPEKVRTKKIDNAFDKINERFGAFTIRSADILYQYAKETELSVDKHEMRFHGNL